MAKQSYLGEIDANDFTKIHWQQLPHHPGKVKYRAASTGANQRGNILFAGGSDNPYNINGIGYNGIPSKASNDVFSWNIKTKQWQVLPPLSHASMDHRGLLTVDNHFYILGGMNNNQHVSDKVISYQVISTK